jgi:putative flippase GtrA
MAKEEIFSTAFVLKFIKFTVVGFSGLFVDFGLTWLFKEKIRIHKFIANAIGFSSAATSNYILNRIWTYQSTNPKIMVEYSEFFAVSLIGLALNTFVIWLLNTKFKINFYVAKVIATIVVTLWNFGANTFFTFKQS